MILQYKDTLGSAYIDGKIDCFQNLVISILNSNCINTNYLGAIWPWLFEHDFGNNTSVIVNKCMCNEHRLYELYNICLKKRKFGENIDVCLHNELNKKSIIVNVDQFYVPHHYSYVYKKQHGRHSLLLLRMEKENILCYDTMPEFKGFINVQQLIEGIMSFPYQYGYMNYCWLESEKLHNSINEYQLANSFMELLKATCIINELGNEGVDLGLNNLIKLIKLTEFENEFQHFEKMNQILAGTWIWENDRYPYWLTKYLKTPYVASKFGSNINETIEKINFLAGQVSIAFKVLYKYLISKRITDYQNGINLLERAKENERIILHHIINVLEK